MRRSPAHGGRLRARTIAALPGSFRITCTYDTNGAMGPVHYGEGTSDEMCLNGFYVTC